MFGFLNPSDGSAHSVKETESTEQVQTDETVKETESEAVENTEETTPADTTENTDSEEDSDDTQNEEVKKPKKGFERRIERFNARLSEKDQEIEYWRKAALNGNQGVEKPAANQASANKPKFEDFNDYELYTEALTDWKVDKKLAEVNQKTAVANVVKTYETRLNEFKKSTPDFQTIMDEFVEDYGNDSVPEIVQVAMDSDIGPAIAYYLAKNTSEVDRIAALPPHRRLLELGKIEDKLSAKTTPVAAVEKKQVSKAAKPIDTIKGGGKVETRTVYDPDLPFEDFVKLREKKK